MTKYICDGCGKEEKGVKGADLNWHKPRNWFQRADGDVIQDACCRACIEKIAEKTGKTKVVLPI